MQGLLQPVHVVSAVRALGPCGPVPLAPWGQQSRDRVRLPGRWVNVDSHSHSLAEWGTGVPCSEDWVGAGENLGSSRAKAEIVSGGSGVTQPELEAEAVICNSVCASCVCGLHTGVRACM